MAETRISIKCFGASPSTLAAFEGTNNGEGLKVSSDRLNPPEIRTWVTPEMLARSKKENFKRN